LIFVKLKRFLMKKIEKVLVLIQVYANNTFFSVNDNNILEHLPFSFLLTSLS